MTGTELIVAAAGTAVIVAINWYFFLAPKTAATASGALGVQEAEIEVRGGYDPGVVRVKRGVPLRLVFNRLEDSGCSEEVVIAAFGLRRFLAPFAKTTVELTPTDLGSFEITCGMSMLHGTLVVED